MVETGVVRASEWYVARSGGTFFLSIFAISEKMYMYSSSSVARTRMAHLPWLFLTR